MELNLKGKTALITGASSGIGKAIKEGLEKEGVKVIHWDKEEGIDLMANCTIGLRKIMQKDIDNCDILINNVGGLGSFIPKNYPEYNIIFDMNAGNMQILTMAYLSILRKYGRVITISSIYGKEKGHNPFFTASKSYQIAFMKSLAGKYPNITFNTICPGHIDVGKPFPDNPKVIGKPEDVANIVVFLCSDLASHINGACITVDGGVSHSF